MGIFLIQELSQNEKKKSALKFDWHSNRYASFGSLHTSPWHVPRPARSLRSRQFGRHVIHIPVVAVTHERQADEAAAVAAAPCARRFVCVGEAEALSSEAHCWCYCCHYWPDN